MRASIDTASTRNWLAARQQVQSLADVVLGDAAAFFLYRGKVFGEGAPGRYVSSFLGSAEECETVLRLIERLDAGGTVEAVVVDDAGREPDGPGRPVLTLLAGHLTQMWPDGRWETV